MRVKIAMTMATAAESGAAVVPAGRGSAARVVVVWSAVDGGGGGGVRARRASVGSWFDPTIDEQEYETQVGPFGQVGLEVFRPFASHIL